jgi:ribonuclease HI
LSDSPGYIVYTDGSAWTGDRIGAYAWVIVDEDGNEVIGGASETDTTISRMELMGAIDALESVRSSVAGPCVVLVYSDSEYVVFGITDRTRQA